MPIYTLIMRDDGGEPLSDGSVQCASDVRAVVNALQLLDADPGCGAIEVWLGRRLIRTLTRADLSAAPDEGVQGSARLLQAQARPAP
jgi:hypothetical protein